jgi:hypothetical protein
LSRGLRVVSLGMNDNQKVDSAAAVFNTAMSFYTAQDRLQRFVNPKGDPNGTIALTAPLVTVCALSIELMLKTLRTIDQGSVPRGHDLHNLFRNLSQPTQIRVRKAWKKHLPNLSREFDLMERQTGTKIDTHLDHMLLSSRQAFERYRYGFETIDGDMPDFLLMSLPGILRNCIVEMRPDLQNWQPKPPGTMGVEFEPAE